MPASTFTSKSRLILILLGVALLGGVPYAHAELPSSQGRTLTPEEDDFSGTPYTDYAEFNDDSEEEADTKFLQYGRLFGVSAAVGFEGVTGNRGALWQGGFPVVDLKFHYWFDFNFSMQLGFTNATHFYVYSGSRTDVNLSRIGLDLKYYFDVKNIGARMTFANPHIILGAGNYSKTETNVDTSVKVSDSNFGLAAGAGLEFVFKPRSAYMVFEGKVHFVNFKDTYTGQFTKKVPDLTGYFYTLTAGVLFTW